MNAASEELAALRAENAELQARLRQLEASFRADVDFRQTAEQERLQLDRKLQQSQYFESISILASGVAHDFNNILTTITGQAELIRAGADIDAETRESADAIIIAVRRATELTSQLLAFAGRGRYQEELIDINEIVHNLLSLLHETVPSSITLRTQVTTALPQIRGDTAQLSRVLLNLVQNAIEAIDQQIGSITIRTDSAYLSEADLSHILFGGSLQAGNYVLLEVVDTGSGMDAATLRRMFDPFFSTRFTGRGLGLAAVQGIVRNHQGALAVESQPGSGTHVQVWLPATDPKGTNELRS